MRTMMGILVLGVLAAGERLAAEDGAAPPLDPLRASEGAFDLDFQPAGGSKGTSLCKIGLGGKWLLEHVRADFGGKPYEGRGSTSYDAARGKYVNVWIDSMSSVPLVSEGTYDAATRTLTLVGDMVAPDGTTAKATLVTVYRDADTRTFTMKAAGPDGKQCDLFQITYRRRVK